MVQNFDIGQFVNTLTEEAVLNNMVARVKKKRKAMKISQNLEIQLMREKYIDKNAIGIVGWAECDSKIQNNQMIAGLKMAASV